MIERSRDGRTLSKNTVRLIRNALSQMLADAFDEELIKSNPAAEPRRPRGRRRRKGGGAKPVVRPFSDAELAQVLEAARVHEPEHYAYLLLLARTGMRPGEGAALVWDDINFTTRSISIERAYSRGVLGETKTGETRVVDMSTELSATLTALDRVRKTQALKNGWGEVPDLIFVNAAGGPLDESRVRKVFKRVMRKAGITGHTLYDLRHSYASLHLAKNTPITYVSSQLGHSDASTTLRWYARWLPQTDHNFADRLDSRTVGSPLVSDDGQGASAAGR